MRPVPRLLLPAVLLLAALCTPLLGTPLLAGTASAATAATPSGSALTAHSRPRPLGLGRTTDIRLAPGTVGSRLARTTRLRAAAPAPTSALTTSASTGAVRTAGAASTWLVTYTGFSPAAQAAFQKAVDIWAAVVRSSVPIEVLADSKDLGDIGLLGKAGPSDFVPQSLSSRLADPVALANAKTGTDQDLGYEDIDATFNSNTPYFCYGASTDSAGCVVDFTTVVLHELGHGLGFSGTFDAVSGLGQYGFELSTGGYWTAPGGQRYAAAFDAFTVKSDSTIASQSMLSYAPGTSALAAVLQGGDGERTPTSTVAPNNGSVYWDGPLGKAAYQGRRPRLFSPKIWEPGSSYSHLSDSDFPPAGGDSLMTPSVGSESIRQPGPVMLGILGDLGYGVPARPGSRFTPVSPVRLLDTRTDATAARRVLGQGGTRDLDVRKAASGIAAVPSGATAVVLNVTGVTASAATFLQAYPGPVSGTGRPTASNLNLRKGETRANLVTVAVPPAGVVRLRNNSGSTAVVVDLAGYYSPGSVQGFRGLPSPVRLADTRASAVTTVGAGGTLRVDVTRSYRGVLSGVPSTASAVVLGLTAVNASRSTVLTAYPTPASGTAFPAVSNLNVAGPAATPNLAVVPVGSGSSVTVRNTSGTVAVLVDVAGFYDGATGGQLFHPIAPERLLDTRSGLGAPQARLGSATTVPLTVSGRAGIPAAATSVVLNLTGVAPTAGTYFAVTPAREAAPSTSSLNLVTGQTAADLVTVGMSGVASKQVWVYNQAAYADVLADAAGWFGPV